MAQFWLYGQKQSVLEADGASLAKKPHLDPKSDGHQSDRNSIGGALTSTTDARKKGNCEGHHS